MDKAQLNQQIVLCRSVVRKAKVCVVRKLIKQIKILRSCKNEKLREKKFRKGRRLAAEIHMMKTLRPDYVTKFALLTEDYQPTGSNTKLKRKRNACAKLAKHKDMVQRITSIREQFPNWREELPLMLKPVAKEKSENEDDGANPENLVETDLNEKNGEEQEVGEIEDSCGEDEDSISEGESSSGERESNAKQQESDDDGEKEEKDETPKNDSEKLFNSPQTGLNKVITSRSKAPRKIKKVKPVAIVNGKKEKVMTVENQRVKAKTIVKDEKKKESKYDVEREEACIKTEEEKVEDPFFIGKKVTAPKLQQVTDKEKSKRLDLSDAIDDEFKPKRDFKTREKPVKRSNYQVINTTTDDLHPSWKAKKMQMIKPFEGKKIKFE